MSFDKSTKIVKFKIIALSTNSDGIIEYLYAKKKRRERKEKENIDLYFLPHTKIHSKMDYGLKSKTLHYKRENICNISVDKDSLDTIPKAQSIKESVDKFNLTKIKKFYF
jgi:hypothetical protein